MGGRGGERGGGRSAKAGLEEKGGGEKTLPLEEDGEGENGGAESPRRRVKGGGGSRGEPLPRREGGLRRAETRGAGGSRSSPLEVKAPGKPKPSPPPLGGHRPKAWNSHRATRAANPGGRTRTAPGRTRPSRLKRSGGRKARRLRARRRKRFSPLVPAQAASPGDARVPIDEVKSYEVVRGESLANAW